MNTPTVITPNIPPFKETNVILRLTLQPKPYTEYISLGLNGIQKI